MTAADPGNPVKNDGPIRAAGCLLWRRAGRAGGGVRQEDGTTAGPVELCLVHRPRYGDWSHPKGKLKPGESALAGALREVLEETGHFCVPGARIGTVDYEVDGRPKTVEYWAAEESGGTFTPGREVDRILWLSPAAAKERLTQPRDRLLVDRLVAALRGMRSGDR